MRDKVFMLPPWGHGEPQEVEATPEILVPLMVAGYTQCQPPTATNDKEVNAE